MFDFIFPPDGQKKIIRLEKKTAFTWPQVPFNIKSLGEMKLYDIPDLNHAAVITIINNKRRYSITAVLGDCGYIKSQDAWVYLPDVHILEGD